MFRLAKVLRALGFVIIGSSIAVAVFAVLLLAYGGYADYETERDMGFDYASFGNSVLLGLACGSVVLLAGVIVGAPLLAVAANLRQDNRPS